MLKPPIGPRALGLLIAKSKCNGGMPYECFTKLYDALVLSIINYGSAIWGAKEYSIINSVHNRACRFFLGVGKYVTFVVYRVWRAHIDACSALGLFMKCHLM